MAVPATTYQVTVSARILVIESAAARTHGAEIPVQHMQRDHEQRREWHEVDQEDQELLGAHQLERDDPEPEVDFEGEIGQPLCGVADDDGGQRRFVLRNRGGRKRWLTTPC